MSQGHISMSVRLMISYPPAHQWYQILLHPQRPHSTTLTSTRLSPPRGMDSNMVRLVHRDWLLLVITSVAVAVVGFVLLPRRRLCFFHPCCYRLPHLASQCLRLPLLSSVLWVVGIAAAQPAVSVSTHHHHHHHHQLLMPIPFISWASPMMLHIHRPPQHPLTPRDLHLLHPLPVHLLILRSSMSSSMRQPPPSLRSPLFLCFR
jgi:hypothetical protein